MKLEKAIEILEIEESQDFQGITYDFEDACRLGIEALKAIKNVRLIDIFYAEGLLPGETEE